ncbi:methyltransferase-like protein 27 [Apostichopus japonicus]|uniref:methyltransferase-like protein 27 n=1 Tax=Stichopus japonicus TaxID=307972 RepID=UPI003AB1CD15
MASTEHAPVQPNSREAVFMLIKEGKGPNGQGVAGTYDNWSKYDEDHNDYNGPSFVVSALSELTNRKDVSILDCGSGTGLIGEKLKSEGFTNISALDASQESLKLAAKKGVYKKLSCVEVGKKKMPFDDNEFDVLVASGCVLPTHISPDALREWVSIVKPGGFILFSIRRVFLELIEGEETYYSKEFVEHLNQVLEELEKTKKAEVIFKRDCPNYLCGWHSYLYGIKVVQ